MQLTVPVFESWSWPWPEWTLHAVYLFSGLLIAAHYGPQIRRAWLFPAATLAAQSLSTWMVWTSCRVVAFLYGVFVVHDLLFLVAVGADILGRVVMVLLILRAQAVVAGAALIEGEVLPRLARELPHARLPRQPHDHNLVCI